MAQAAAHLAAPPPVSDVCVCRCPPPFLTCVLPSLPRLRRVCRCPPSPVFDVAVAALPSPSQFFLTCVFKTEEELHVKEGVPWKEIEFQDNQPAIELMEKPPNGILRLLDSQCKVVIPPPPPHPPHTPHPHPPPVLLAPRFRSSATPRPSCRPAHRRSLASLRQSRVR